MSQSRNTAILAVVALAFCMSLLATADGYAQQSDDIVITTHHINPVRDAQTPWDEAQNCLRDPVCAAAVTQLPPRSASRQTPSAWSTPLLRSRQNKREKKRATRLARSADARFAVCRCGRLPWCQRRVTAHRCFPSPPPRRPLEFIRGRRGKGLAPAEAGMTAWSSSLTSRRSSRMTIPNPGNVPSHQPEGLLLMNAEGRVASITVSRRAAQRICKGCGQNS